MTRVRCSLAPALVLALALVMALPGATLVSGCAGSAASSRAAKAKNNAIVLIECDVGDAELWVDDRFVAHVQNLKRGIALRAGTHRLELRHDRFHTHYQELTVRARERRTVVVEMAEILP